MSTENKSNNGETENGESSNKETYANIRDLEKDKSDEVGCKPKVKILEIAHLLQQKVIFLTGGKDKDGHPLIFCSESNPVIPYSKEGFQKAITFLTDLARLLWNHGRFVVILNRKNGKWNNVKETLKYLDIFCEKNIHQILLVKPQGFLQRNFSSVDENQLQKLSKHKVVLIDVQSDLHEFIELNQLPSDLGGFDGFNIIEWVEYTTAVERFQVTCKKIGKRVKDAARHFQDKPSFACIEDIETQFKQHQQLVEDIQNDIHCAVEISDTLSPIVNKPLSYSRKTQSVLEKYNSAELQVCTDDLLLHSSDIEKLWVGQQTYHDQAKELCRFEEDYSKHSITLLQITSILESRSDIGDTLTSARDLMDELDDFELKRKEPYQEMMKLKEKGTTMMVLFEKFSHNTVKLRLDEMKILLHDFEVKLKARRELLQVSLDVFECLDKLEAWCQGGVALLAAQPVEAFSTENGAKECLKELDRFMKKNQGVSMKKMNQLNSLCKILGNKMINEKVQVALERIEEVKEMLEKREASLTKVAIKPVRPVQTVKAMVLDEDQLMNRRSDKGSSKSQTLLTPPTPTTPTFSGNKEEIKVVTVTDNIEKYKRNKTFRKSLRVSAQRPISSAAQLQMAEYEEDPEHRKKIRHVITELITTEDLYINDLRNILEGYYVAFDDTNFDIPQHIRSQKTVVFGNIEEIFDFHNGRFRKELEKCKDAPYLAGQVFMNEQNEFQLYATYCKNKPRSEALRRELHNTKFLNECQRRLNHQLNLDSYLLKPVQRVTKYRLLLTEILKYVSKNNPAHADIMEALHTMQDVLRHVNDVMHSSGLIGFEGDLDDQGKLLLQESFTIWENKKNAAIKQFTKLGGKHRQVFLFEKCLIFSKREHDGNGKDRGTYRCKRSVKTASIGVTEMVKGHELKFEVWVHGRNDVYHLQAENIKIKNNWLNQMRKMLMQQFEEKRKPISSVDDLQYEQPKRNITTEEFREKLKTLDSSLSGSTPLLLESFTQNTNDTADQFVFTDQRSLSTSNVADVHEDSDSSWSESEFYDDHVHEEEDGHVTAQDDVTVVKREPINNSRNTNQSKRGTKTFSYETEFPAENPEIGVYTFTAKADYEAVEQSEISFESGALINLIKEGEGGWWYCKHLKTRQEGWAPSGYLELYVVDVTNNKDSSEIEKLDLIKPSIPSPRIRLETTV